MVRIGGRRGIEMKKKGNLSFSSKGVKGWGKSPISIPSPPPTNIISLPRRSPEGKEKKKPEKNRINLNSS